MCTLCKYALALCSIITENLLKLYAVSGTKRSVLIVDETRSIDALCYARITLSR